MPTIATQLFRTVAPGIVLALLIGGIVLDLLIGDRLENEFDAVLVNKARTLAALTEYEDGVLEIERYDHVLPRYADSISPDYFEIRDETGLRLLASPALPNDLELAGGRAGDAEWRRYAELELPDGRPGRRFTLTFTPVVDDEEPTDKNGEVGSADGRSIVNGSRLVAPSVVLTVAVPRESLDELLGSVHLSLLLTGLGVMVALFLVARRAIRIRLRPLAEIGRQIEALAIDHPEQRLVLESSSEEIDRLTGRFNELLERVDTALERERRFSEDVAHELRTPIAELRSLLEVRARFPHDAELAAHFEQDQRMAVQRMERTVTQLLALGRAETSSNPVGPDAELAALIEGSLARFELKARERGLVLQTDIDDDGLRVAGEQYWQGITDNLIQNAVSHASAGSVVCVELAMIGSGCRLRISNDTDDLEPADMDSLFDRLWRKEASRSSTYHSGIGLALVSAYARALGLGIDAELVGHRLTMTVSGACARSVPSVQDVCAPPPRSGSVARRLASDSSAQ